MARAFFGAIVLGGTGPTAMAAWSGWSGRCAGPHVSKDGFDFKTEFVSLLDKNDAEYDERYLWS